MEAGVPGIGIIQDGRKYFDYHHTAADTLDKVDPQELSENAAAMAVMGYALAAMPDTLPRESQVKSKKCRLAEARCHRTSCDYFSILTSATF